MQEPDRVRTAVVCELHRHLCKSLGRYGVLLGLLHTEMTKAIYHNLATAIRAREHSTSPSTSHTPPVYTQEVPFFDATHQMQKQLELLKKKLADATHVDAILQSESRRREVAIKLTRRVADRRAMSAWFVRWKLIAEHYKINGSMIIKIRGSFAILKSLTQRQGANLAQRIFAAWVKWTTRSIIANLRHFVQMSQEEHGTAV
jgi:hypothetical protein